MGSSIGEYKLFFSYDRDLQPSFCAMSEFAVIYVDSPKTWWHEIHVYVAKIFFRAREFA